ncbi:MAG: hypothetical protein HC827_06395 [Cyanobacteria bacterium RM1_2_2]|nr:hypothetical protein [Cyanobacteria bacterium RM1_2_2]
MIAQAAEKQPPNFDQFEDGRVNEQGMTVSMPMLIAYSCYPCYPCVPIPA